MASREFLYIVEESAYGTPVTSPVVGTNAFYARLHQSDGFTGQWSPVFVDIPYGGGFVTPGLTVSDQYTANFTFTTYLYSGSYSAMLLNWCMTPINSGRTAPWVTTDANYIMPVGDLASMSFYHALEMADGTYDRRRYGGCKCTRWSLTCSRGSPVALLTVNGVAISDNKKGDGTTGYPDTTEFPTPTDAQYPVAPYMFSHSGGHLTLIDSGSSTRAQYNTVTLTGANTVDAQWFESQSIQLARFCGRTTTLGATFYWRPTPDDLAFLQNKTVLKTSLGFNDGTHGFTIDMKSTNYMKALTRNLPLGAAYTRSVTVQNNWDVATGTDLVLTTT